mmetsp:Transcript_142865/g.456341  ORF Transcript_142865/g.456341 Transcript_142865/m.456341 type:complete len:260 (-) Transcript_142865:785-1564(-)
MYVGLLASLEPRSLLKQFASQSSVLLLALLAEHSHLLKGLHPSTTVLLHRMALCLHLTDGILVSRCEELLLSSTTCPDLFVAACGRMLQRRPQRLALRAAPRQLRRGSREFRAELVGDPVGLGDGVLLRHHLLPALLHDGDKHLPRLVQRSSRLREHVLPHLGSLLQFRDPLSGDCAVPDVSINEGITTGGNIGTRAPAAAVSWLQTGVREHDLPRTPRPLRRGRDRPLCALRLQRLRRLRRLRQLRRLGQANRHRLCR